MKSVKPVFEKLVSDRLFGNRYRKYMMNIGFINGVFDRRLIFEKITNKRSFSVGCGIDNFWFIRDTTPVKDQK